jgi:hypothetical protein
MALAAIHRNRVQGLEAKTSSTAKRRSAQKRAREARDDPLGVLRAVTAAEALWDFRALGGDVGDETAHRSRPLAASSHCQPNDGSRCYFEAAPGGVPFG